MTLLSKIQNNLKKCSVFFIATKKNKNTRELENNATTKKVAMNAKHRNQNKNNSVFFGKLQNYKYNSRMTLSKI